MLAQEMLAILMTAIAILYTERGKSRRMNRNVNSGDWAGKCSEAHPHFPLPACTLQNVFVFFFPNKHTKLFFYAFKFSGKRTEVENFSRAVFTLNSRLYPLVSD